MKRWSNQKVENGDNSLPTLKYEYILNHLTDGMTICDVGCGEGRVLESINRDCKGVKLYGCDIIPPRKKSKEFKFSLIEKNKLPYNDNTFDMVISIDCLEHIRSYKTILLEMRRILKPNGMIHLFIPCEGETFSMYSFLKIFFGKRLFERTKYHMNAFTKKDIITTLKSYFSIVEIKYSYHIIGHIMDALLFTATLNKKISDWFWKENKYYTDNKKGIGNKLMTLANNIAYKESKFFQDTHLCSHAIHITLIKLGV